MADPAPAIRSYRGMCLTERGRRRRIFLFGLIYIAQGLVSTVTLGFVSADWSLDFAFRLAHCDAEKARRAADRSET